MPTVKNAQQTSIAFENTWLPSPMQLLEEPIDPARRQQVIARFNRRNPQSGYIVRALPQANDRFSQWISLVEQYYVPDGRWESDHYQVYKFRPRLPNERS
jgi:hypothetical protein